MSEEPYSQSVSLTRTEWELILDTMKTADYPARYEDPNNIKNIVQQIRAAIERSKLMERYSHESKLLDYQLGMQRNENIPVLTEQEWEHKG